MLPVKARRRAGFTLIELMVTVAVIGILTSISIRNYQGYQDRSNNVAVTGNLQKLEVGLEQFAADNNDTYPTATNLVATGTYSFLTRYMDKGTFPKAPWSKTPQTTMPAVPAAFADSAGAAKDLLSSAKPAGTVPKNTVNFSPNAVGAVPTAQAAPSANNHFGVLLYDLVDTTGNRTYALYGVGKRGDDAVIVGSASNLTR